MNASTRPAAAGSPGHTPLQTGVELLRAGRYEAAAPWLERAVAAGECSAAEALDLRARASAQQGFLLQAERLWCEAQALEPDNPLPARALARLRSVVAGSTSTASWGPALLTTAVLLVLGWAGLGGVHDALRVQAEAAAFAVEDQAARSASLQERLVELNAQVGLQQGALDGLTAQGASRDETLQRLGTQAAALHEGLVGQQAALAALREGQDAQQARLTALHEDLDRQQASLTTLHDGLDGQQASLTALHEHLDGQQASLTVLHEGQAGQQSRLAALDAILQDQGARLDTLHTDLGDHGGELSALRSGLEEQVNQLSAIDRALAREARAREQTHATTDAALERLGVTGAQQLEALAEVVQRLEATGAAQAQALADAGEGTAKALATLRDDVDRLLERLQARDAGLPMSTDQRPLPPAAAVTGDPPAD